LNYNEVFSKYSNPAVCLQTGILKDIGFQMVGYNSNTKEYSLSIQINNTGVLSLSPSKPQNLKVTSLNGYVHLTWNENLEPDMRYSGKYKTFRAVSWDGLEPTSYEFVTEINAYNGKVPVTSWTDYETQAGTGNYRMYYKISAVDNSMLESVKSESDWVAYGDLWKRGQGNTNLITEFKLFDNYPNPFNPSTTISYQLPTSCFVKITVYNSLCKEVCKIVNEFKEEGSYEVQFNAEGSASGVYFYHLEAYNNDKIIYQKTNRMLLLK
jgi:hypothetical protein